jgi:GNAT superfamily N-acetyltransferase
MPSEVAIRRYVDVAARTDIDRAIDAIFFEASSAKSFASDAARAAFRERWLGRYLEHDPQFAYVALAASGEAVGYLVGAVDDPALAERFFDIGYFATFGALTKRFPAHLHVNVAPDYRGRRIGGRLVAMFSAEAARAGVPGVHVVTSAGAANVAFYNRNGFIETGRAGALVFLGRSLA